MDFSKEIAAARVPIIRLLQELVRIDSQQGAPEEGMPFGKGPAEALQCVLAMGKDMGFKTENFENYVGHIDYGSGEEMLGILCHLDIVPAGDGWICDPFGAEIINGKLYGRGTLDDKGPTIVCLYAMKILKDLGIPLRKKIRMILGTNEETNWACMEWYLKNVKTQLPDMAFSPDAVFPVIYAEKGSLQYIIRKKISEDLQISGGNAFNSVADTAHVLLPSCYKDALQEACRKWNDLGCVYELQDTDSGILFNVIGTAAHAARLESGRNAISSMMAVLGELDLSGELKNLVDFYNEKIGLTIYGEKMGLDMEDEESGKLTFNVGKLRAENGEIAIYIDNRIPVTMSVKTAEQKARQSLQDTAFDLTVHYSVEPLYIPKDSYLVQTLMDTYRDITGDNQAQPLTAGGATYSRMINNCVAYGCIVNGQENSKHHANEYLELDKIDLWLRLYLEAIYRLAQ